MLPLEAVSYTQVAKEWSIVQTEGESLIQLRAKSAHFKRCWDEKAKELKSLELSVHQCIN